MRCAWSCPSACCSSPRARWGRRCRCWRAPCRAHDANFGRVLGRLYGWNTLGAVLGTLAGRPRPRRGDRHSRCGARGGFPEPRGGRRRPAARAPRRGPGEHVAARARTPLHAGVVARCSPRRSWPAGSCWRSRSSGSASCWRSRPRAPGPSPCCWPWCCWASLPEASRPRSCSVGAPTRTTWAPLPALAAGLGVATSYAAFLAVVPPERLAAHDARGLLPDRAAADVPGLVPLRRAVPAARRGRCTRGSATPRARPACSRSPTPRVRCSARSSPGSSCCQQLGVERSLFVLACSTASSPCSRSSPRRSRAFAWCCCGDRLSSSSRSRSSRSG